MYELYVKLVRISDDVQVSPGNREIAEKILEKIDEGWDLLWINAWMVKYHCQNVEAFLENVEVKKEVKKHFV